VIFISLLQCDQELIAKKTALQNDESALDIGCVDEMIRARLAQIVKDGRFLGIDSSANMIQHASQLFSP